ncbi:murein DD-endopeptidase MepM/ murein hydrolase activator NlpD [Sphingomonas sp. BE138]|uniref:M23 family metallopeptidase n=1 Tax=Sphingomonas sp. BE138 TaxID=2817845 RepID=UPI00285FF590|nr:M23 family metallopeptidase [Sphingomonas sp. BE138]MDR6789010.1 murein DD-endopeptidase MepM/ murein hydrolase activator NlpD [Sphingomonas sp. BE138]
MFLREQQGLEWAGAGGAGAGGAGAAATRFPAAPAQHPLRERLRERVRVGATQTDWVPDLGRDIGSRTWWRGLATCTALCAGAWWLSPGWRPIVGAGAPAMTEAAFEEARTQSFAPLALGATTGRRMAAGALVRPLAETPERPQIELTAAIADGDTLPGALQRAGVGGREAARVAALVGGAAPRPGTVLSLTLGRRPTKYQPRPLEKLDFRAAFDLNMTVLRAGDGLTVVHRPIAIDRTPLHVRGIVGASLYRSARAAGVPARVVESYLKALGAHMPIERIAASDTFDIVADQQRAATGEVEVGALQYAGLDQGRRKVTLVRWGDRADDDGGEGGTLTDPGGQVERQGTMGMPVAGRVTSTFGMRMHPLLGFMRMHKGTDIGAPYGSPIYAAMDGVVQFAGRSGGYGNFVKLAHAGGLASGYGHMSRFAVGTGARVRRGQVIGYVGSTGISTGPHLHWEVWQNGRPVNPRAISMSSLQTLPAATIRAMKAKIARLVATPLR